MVMILLYTILDRSGYLQTLPRDLVFVLMGNAAGLDLFSIYLVIVYYSQVQ